VNFYKTISKVVIIINILFFWIIFNPTISGGPDEFYQYNQALNGVFGDWYPPLMSIITNWIISIKLPFSCITFVQCALFFFGIMYLIEKISYLIVCKKNRDLIQFITILFMISPISPLPYKTMYWSIDTWFTISFIYLIINSLDLYQLIKKNNRTYYFKIFLISFISAFSMNLRYNAVFLAFPICSFIYFITNKRLDNYKRILLATLPLVMFLSINFGISKHYKIKKDYHFNFIMLLDTIGLIVDNPNLVDEFPYVSSILEPYYREFYMFGNVAPLMNLNPIIVKINNQTIRKSNPKLVEEYKKMIFDYPIKFIIVKIKSWFNLIKINGYKAEVYISKNSFLGMPQNKLFENLRSFIHKVDHHIISKMISIKYTIRGNTIWFFVNILFILQVIMNQKLSMDNKIMYLSLLMFPFFYYLSYIAANPGGGHRYVYPSVMILQIYFLVVFLKKLFRLND